MHIGGRSGRWALVALTLSAGVCGLLAGRPTAAQEPPPTTVPPVDPAAAPVDPAAPPVTPTPTAPPPVLPSTTTIVPLNCTQIPPPYLVFVGRITAYQVPTFRFQVDQVLSGTWDGPLVDVDFPDDAGFLRLGPSYVVAAQVDSTTGKLYSKVRYTFSNQPGAGMCPGEDPIITRLSDGSPVDTAILSGMKGRWNKALVAFLVPTVAVMGALVLVVSLKHLATKVLRVGPVSTRRPYP